jgi:prepilin-type N-terminal cleavage/methylation domain-containing protein
VSMPFRRRREQRGDSGFSMIEMMAALVVIGLLSAGSVAFFTTSLGGVNGQKQRQAAVFLADQQLQTVESLPVGKLVAGRTQTCVNTLFASAAATRLKISTQDDTSNSANYDSTAANCNAPTVPITTTKTVNNVVYTLTTFVDTCWYDDATGLCGPTSSSTTNQEYRVSVDVAWTGKGNCSTGCTFNANTIIDPTADPLYNTNISAPTGSVTTPASATIFNDSTNNAMEITGTNFQNNIRVVISSGGGTVTNISQPNGGLVDFTLAGGDVPGSYTISVINADGGHFQTTLNEVPQLSAVSGWTTAGRVLNLTGGGFEPGATLATPAGYTLTRTSYTAASIASWTGPVNGASSTLKVNNPDGTSASYTITAPKVTSVSDSLMVAGMTQASTVTGTGFNTVGLVATASNGTVSIGSPVTATSVPLSIKPTSTGTDTVTLYNTDGSSATYTFTVNAAPTLSTLSPSSVTHSTLTTFTLTGTGFQAGATVAVTYQGTAKAVSNVTVSSATQITFKFTPSASPTSGTATIVVTVTNPDGGTVSKTFTVTAS